MFKLKKILNGKTNVPEIQLWNQDASVYIKAGCVYVLEDTTLLCDEPSSYPNCLKLLSTSTIEDEYYDGPIPAFIITNDMVFEVDLKSDTFPPIGSKVKVAFDNRGVASMVEPVEEGGDALVIATHGSDTKTVDVMFF